MSDRSEEHDVLFASLKNSDELAYEEIYYNHSKFLLQAAYQKTKDKFVAEDRI